MTREDTTVTWRHVRAALAVGCSLIAVSCGGDSGTGPPEEESEPTTIVIIGGNGQSGPAGAALGDSVAVRVNDQNGEAMAGVLVTWVVVSGGGTITPSSVNTSATGVARARWILGPGGEQAAEARVTGIGAASFNAQALPPPVLESVSPAQVVPGQAATITGQNFNASPSANTVQFNGVDAVVTTASQTQLTVTVPCIASGPTTIQVTVGAVSSQIQHVAQAAATITLAAGESADWDASPANCKELVGGGRYVFAVANGDESTNGIPVRVRGSANNGVASPPIVVTPAAPAPARPRGLRARVPELADWRDNHIRQLQASQRLITSGLPPAAAAPALQTAGLPDVGDMISVKVPDLNTSLCNTAATVQARVVYVGAHSVIAEDVNAAAAGQMDTLYVSLGDEFENVMYPIILANFGSPFAAKNMLDGDEVLTMVFTPETNDFNVGGFVSSGDFLSTSGQTACPASNQNEIFYGAVPTQATGGYTANALTPEIWYLVIRSIVIHEVKHISGFANRIGAMPPPNTVYEAIWIEEGAAVVSEELYARDLFGYLQNANVEYANSLYCEVRNVPQSGVPACLGYPQVMFDYWEYLHDYLDSIETLTPVGPVGGGSDPTFYGSSWSLLRWLADRSGVSEASFFQDLTQETMLRGKNHLESISGLPFGEMIADWALSLNLDDRAGIAALPAALTFPSWNSRSIFSGMAADFPGLFVATPWDVRNISYGNFSISISQVRGGTASILELSGVAPGAQAVEVTGSGGAPLDPNIFVKVVRIQ